jgi:hypothetical protein
LHLRFNGIDDPEMIPSGTAYSAAFESNIPLCNRLDSRHAAVSLLSAIAFADAQ